MRSCRARGLSRVECFADNVVLADSLPCSRFALALQPTGCRSLSLREEVSRTSSFRAGAFRRSPSVIGGVCVEGACSGVSLSLSTPVCWSPTASIPSTRLAGPSGSLGEGAALVLFAPSGDSCTPAGAESDESGASADVASADAVAAMSFRAQQTGIMLGSFCCVEHALSPRAPSGALQSHTWWFGVSCRIGRLSGGPAELGPAVAGPGFGAGVVSGAARDDLLDKFFLLAGFSVADAREQRVPARTDSTSLVSTSEVVLADPGGICTTPGWSGVGANGVRPFCAGARSDAVSRLLPALI